MVHGQHVDSLDGQYTVFAHMVSGLDVLDSIASVECEFGAGRERSHPTERVEITEMSVAIIEEPEEEEVVVEGADQTSGDVPATEGGSES